MNNTGIFPRFHIRAVENKLKSREAGRPIFEDREYVEILIAGDKSTVHCPPVNDEHRHRWPEQYRAFKAELETPLEGTPIEQWPAMSASQVAELKALHILTVEALAELPDNGVKNLGMGGRELVAKAKAYLDSAGSTALVQKQAEEIEKLKRDIERLSKQIVDLGAAPKKRPGRRKKVEVEAA